MRQLGPAIITRPPLRLGRGGRGGVDSDFCALNPLGQSTAKENRTKRGVGPKWDNGTQRLPLPILGQLSDFPSTFQFCEKPAPLKFSGTLPFNCSARFRTIRRKVKTGSLQIS